MDRHSQWTPIISFIFSLLSCPIFSRLSFLRNFTRSPISLISFHLSTYHIFYGLAPNSSNHVFISCCLVFARYIVLFVFCLSHVLDPLCTYVNKSSGSIFNIPFSDQDTQGYIGPPFDLLFCQCHTSLRLLPLYELPICPLPFLCPWEHPYSYALQAGNNLKYIVQWR
jgi:hypothetical protein